MNEYRCIACGETILSDKQCSCLKCGYTMFKSPYIKKDLLARECNKFIIGLFEPCITEGDFDYYRIETNTEDPNIKTTVYLPDDLCRFPDFRKIQKYIFSDDKSEGVCERAKNTLINLKKHLCSPYQNKYSADYKNIRAIYSERAAKIEETIAYFGGAMKAKTPEFPPFTLYYSETCDERLSALAFDLIDKLDLLIAKTAHFIRQNNIYGSLQYNGDLFALTKTDRDTDYLSLLSFAKDTVERTIDKKYDIDLFSNGKPELFLMLTVFFDSLNLLLKAPILVPSRMYRYADGIVIYGDGNKAITENAIKDAVSELKEFFAENFQPQNYSEDRLFEIYNAFIELDTFGILSVDKNALVKSGESERKLDKLIGLYSVKELIKKIKAYVLANKDDLDLNLHMCFYGNPGTGKTEVARIIAGILYESNILPTKNVIEVDRSGLVGQYVGETPLKTLDKINQAMGGVLFIDEAYSLVPNGGGFDYGDEAIATLIKAMEDRRGKFCVILAGYQNEMSTLLSSNPGLESRIQFTLHFPDYNRDELEKIVLMFASKKKYVIDPPALQCILDAAEYYRCRPNFANARTVRNILDGVIMNQNFRTKDDPDNNTITREDVEEYISNENILNGTSYARRIGF